MQSGLLLVQGAGWVAWLLLAVGWLLWTLVALRTLSLGLSTRSAASWTASFSEEARAVVPRLRQWSLQRHVSRLSSGRFALRVLIAVAPLLGLLGTVSGMVEMFASLPGGGGADESTVARGISTALFTTQLGLIIAAPGLVAARLLERRELRLKAALEQVVVELPAEATS